MRRNVVVGLVAFFTIVGLVGGFFTYPAYLKARSASAQTQEDVRRDLKNRGFDVKSVRPNGWTVEAFVMFGNNGCTGMAVVEPYKVPRIQIKVPALPTGPAVQEFWVDDPESRTTPIPGPRDLRTVVSWCYITDTP